MNDEKRNITKYYLSTAFSCVLSLAINGTVLQTFMLEFGVSENDVGTYMAMVQMIQVIIYIVISPKVDQIHNILGLAGWCYIFCVPLILLIMVMSCQQISLLTGQILLCVAGLLCSLHHGIYGITSYKIVYHIMDMKNYTRILSVSVVIGHLTGTTVSVLLAFFQRKYEYFSVMFGFYFLALILVICSIVITLKMKTIYWSDRSAKTKEKKIRLWSYEPFRSLAVANVLRGINNGVVSIAVTIGYHMNILDKETASVIVIVTHLAAITGNSFIIRTTTKMGEDKQILISSIIVALALPLMVTSKNSTIFIIFYGIAYFCIAVISTAVPGAVAKLINYEVAAQYAGWRMMLFTCGMSISGFICIPMIDLFGGFITLVLAGAAQLISGIMYYKYYNKRMKKKVRAIQ